MCAEMEEVVSMRDLDEISRRAADGAMTREDGLALLGAEIGELAAAADEMRRAAHRNEIELCAIISARAGRCGEDCKFCAQSARYGTGAAEHPFLPEHVILDDARRIEASGVKRYSLVTSGRKLGGAELEAALSAYRAIRRETGLSICASHGLQTDDEFRALADTGVDRYHSNIETSRRHFAKICSTHSFDDKIANIKRAQAAGLEVCSGGIVGMGESWEDRIDMALTLAELGVVSIPINFLIPIKGTPLEGASPMSEEDALRTIAIFRFANPRAWIRIAAGRGRFPNGGEALFRAGADSAITGDMLTSSGSGIADDMKMSERMGLKTV